MFDGIEAVAIEHEVDHTLGVLITDRVRKPWAPGHKIGRNDPCPECQKKGIDKKWKKCIEHNKDTKKE